MNEIKWGEPQPLRQRADAIPFPLDALPTVLRNMAQAISVTTSTDVWEWQGQRCSQPWATASQVCTDLQARQTTQNHQCCILLS